MSAKETQNDFSLLLITEMCPVPFRFSLLQQDAADRRLIFFSLASYSIGKEHIYHNTQSTYVQYHLC